MRKGSVVLIVIAALIVIGAVAMRGEGGGLGRKLMTMVHGRR
jgi:hypothetical protein